MLVCRRFIAFTFIQTVFQVREPSPVFLAQVDLHPSVAVVPVNQLLLSCWIFFTPLNACISFVTRRRVNDVQFREASKLIANEIPCLFIFVCPVPPMRDVHCYAHHEFQAMQFRGNIIFNVLNRWLHADLIILCIKALNIYPWLAIKPVNI